ncbi:IS66-like element accessory protein TnpA [Rhodoblastus sp.]|uniref:IS66-like element accessory protein TnpA n=1 Tax=Rhodoblastus sp. TaxID=1962975 RepID=UPI003F9A43F2
MSDTELLPKSKPEPVRRLEEFTGSGRRRTWTPAHKAEILAESYESGEKVSAIARRHGLTPQQLFGWRREAKRRARRRAANDEVVGRGTTFAPVVVEEALRRSEAQIGPDPSCGAAAIEIVIGAATVRVAPGTDAATLTTVLRAVKAAT